MTRTYPLLLTKAEMRLIKDLVSVFYEKVTGPVLAPGLNNEQIKLDTKLSLKILSKLKEKDL